jgi:surface antigen
MSNPELQQNTHLELAPSHEFTSKARRILGRIALSLTLTSSAAVAITAGETIFDPEIAYAVDFANDYPDLNASAYNPSEYEWWVDENSNSSPDVPAELQSSRGYYYRNCTDGAAYWTNKYTGVNVAGWGNAKAWEAGANNDGYDVKSGASNDIEPGDIAQSDDGDYGHVGFVTEVTKDSNGAVTSIKVAEMNKSGDGNYSHNTYTSKNGSGKFIRFGSNDWDNFIDVNGAGLGLNDEVVSGSSSSSGGLNDVLDATGDSSLGWRTSIDGQTGWHYDYLDTTRTKDTLLIGDFDNDGELDDVMDTTNDSSLGWRVSNNGKTGWAYDYLNSTRMASTMIVGDFDHDGFMDDVLDTPGDSSVGWRVSKNGKNAWDYSYLNTSRTKSTLLIGDFDHDGYIDDILDTTGSSSLGWRVSENGTGAWDYSYLASSRTAANMFVGDFDHDGYVDDILDTGSSLGWRVSYNGQSAWDYDYRDSSMPASELAVGDFDDDGYLDDVFNAGGPGVGWRVSYEGKSSWDNLYGSSRSMGSLVIGEFSG